ncbi:hypothetical protein BGX26_012101 [Mortierella sp. AD094]|nr:hypothetical protein BGX26_012101 [Mortierella sp. AD094]
MIPARKPTSSDAFVVISQTIVGAAGGMANIASSVAVTGAVVRKDVSTVIGVTQILGAFGNAFGGALAGGIWTQYLPSRLHHYVTGPYDEYQVMNNPDYVSALDPTTKHQVIEAYSDSQMLMSIISMTLAVFACLCTVAMKHVDLRQNPSEGQDMEVEEVVEKEEEDEEDKKWRAM